MFFPDSQKFFYTKQTKLRFKKKSVFFTENFTKYLKLLKSTGSYYLCLEF